MAWMGAGRAAALALALLTPMAAQAQFSDSYNFLKAVKDADGQKVTDLIQKPGSTVINSRDVTTGETALHLVINRRDATWIAFLLAKGANPNLTDTNGNTPLMDAVQARFDEGVRLLIANGAQVDKANGSGETPLIRAVQLRDVAMVRLLVSKGANSDRRDSIAGMSARDYAERESRTPGLVEALSAGKLGPFMTTELQRRTLLSTGQPIDYARGLRLGKWRGLEEISHSGATAGYRAWLGRFPKPGVSVALLCNAGDAGTTKLAHKVAALIIDSRELSADESPDEPEPTHVAERLDGIDLQQFVGRYRSDEADATYQFVIEAGQGIFRVDRRPEIRIPLVATGQDAFRGDEPGVSAEDQTVFRFYRDHAARIVELGITVSRVHDLRLQLLPNPARSSSLP